MSPIGETHGHLTIIADDGIKNHKRRYLCRCVCGTVKSVLMNNLRRGLVRSCGCIRCPRKNGHGMSKNLPEYFVWKSMRARCNNPNNRDYALYGGRGIAVCPAWDSFQKFLSDMGRRPSSKHSIDRIDSNGNYEPSNCRWATDTQQRRNKRNNRHFLDADGNQVVIADLSRPNGVCPKLARSRYLRYGWSLHDAVSTPHGGRSRDPK